MPITDDSGREAGWKGKALFSGTLLSVSALIFLSTFDVIKPTSGEGPPPPKWIGVLLGTILGIGGIAPMAEPVFQRSKWAAGAFVWVLVIAIVGGLAAVAHWAVIKSARGLIGHGVMSAILNGITVIVFGAVALLLDGYLVYALFWSVREALRNRRRR